MQRKIIRCLWTLGAVALFVAMLSSSCASPTYHGGQHESVLYRQLEQAAQRGLEVIHNATVVPCRRTSGHGQITLPAGTEYDDGDYVLGDGYTFYKNKSDTLTIAIAQGQIKYVRGKGVMKYKDKIFCFGF